MEEYRNLFDKLVAPLPQLPKEVLEETFMNGLYLWIKAEVECWFAQMMKLAQRAENREVTRGEAGLKTNLEGKSQSTLPHNKLTNPSKVSENKSGGTVPKRTITLHGTTTIENRREGPVHTLTNAEFQARRDKGLFSL